MASKRKIQVAALVAVGLALPANASAQQLSAHVSAPITITVRPTLTIRSVVPAPTRVDPDGHLTSSAVVHVESNLPYRLAVRVALAPTGNARVLVRRVDGAFQPLLTGESITTVVSRAQGHRSHEVVCRIEMSETTERCLLIYELSAEHEDVLIRTTAVDRGLRIAHAGSRERRSSQ